MSVYFAVKSFDRTFFQADRIIWYDPIPVDGNSFAETLTFRTGTLRRIEGEKIGFSGLK